jgi:hypothetical protein
VFVKYQTNSLTGQQEVANIIVGEIKRSGTTALTHGQELGKAGVGGNLSVKSFVGDDATDIFGNVLPGNTFTVSKQIPQTKFVEIRGNGAGGYAKGGTN